MLDCGIRVKEIQEATGYTLASVDGCLVTHSHSDHCKGAIALERLGVDVYASKGTLMSAGLLGHRSHAVKPLAPFVIGSFTILPFDVEHDAPDPLGFMAESKVTGDRLLYVTDTAFLKYSFDRLTHILIEANYDPEIMAKNVETGRLSPPRAKRTVKNHMSIDTAIKYLERVDKTSLQQVFLIHLSNENSDENQFVLRAMEATGSLVKVC